MFDLNPWIERLESTVALTSNFPRCKENIVMFAILIKE